MNPINANPHPYRQLTADELWGMLGLIRRITTATPEERAFKDLLWRTCVRLLLNRLPQLNEQEIEREEGEELRNPNRNTYVP